MSLKTYGESVVVTYQSAAPKLVRPGLVVSKITTAMGKYFQDVLTKIVYVMAVYTRYAQAGLESIWLVHNSMETLTVTD